MTKTELHFEWIEPQLKGPVLLFLHEGLGSTTQWKDFPSELCAVTGLSGLLYDRLGHGRSPALTEPRDESYLEKYALKELPQFIADIGLERNLILVGHSDGGTIALIYASRYPQRVKGIITEAAHIYVEPVTWTGIAPVIKEFESKTKLYEALKRYHGDKFEETFYAWAKTWEKKNQHNWNVSHYLTDIQAPLLAIQGEDDQYATPQHLEDIVNLTSGPSTAVHIPGCQHNPHLEARETALHLMEHFIKGII